MRVTMYDVISGEKNSQIIAEISGSQPLYIVGSDNSTNYWKIQDQKNIL